MPQREDGSYYIFGSRADPNRDPDRVMKNTKPRISESVLSVTIGERLRKRCPPVNVKGDRPAFEDDAD